MEILAVMPEEYHSEHAQRAWLIVTELLNTPGLAVRLIVGERGDIGSPQGALVFNAPRDAEVLQAMRAAGVPTVYSLGPGALHGWEFRDRHLATADCRFDRRTKLALATLAHVDTHAQAQAAAAAFGGHPRWLVLPPAALSAPRQGRPWQPVSQVVVYGTLPGFDPEEWAAEQELTVLRFREELPMINHVTQHAGCMALFLQPPYYGERLLAVAAAGVPLAAVSCGLLPEGEEAEWAASTGDAEGDVSYALTLPDAARRALHWDADRVQRQVAAATERTWADVAGKLVAGLRSNAAIAES